MSGKQTILVGRPPSMNLNVRFHPPNIVWNAFILFLSLAVAPVAQAHKPSDSYLRVKVADGAISGQWDIALRDLEHAIGLDANDDGVITWGEVRSRFDVVDAYALARLTLSADGARGRVRITDHLVDYHTDGAYLVLRFAVEEVSPRTTLDVDYRLFFDVDPQHHGLLRFEQASRERAAILTPEQPSVRLELETPAPFAEFVRFVDEGVWHIWQGFDHILFLLALLLPAVLSRQRGEWLGVGGFRPAFVNVLKIVSAFTVAHSLTLSLAALHVLNLPSRFVESTIAASVALAALNNLFPMVRDRAWSVAFLFGLIHGFGFAGVLGDLGLTGGSLARALVGFNLGVEVGQLAIVSVFLPLSYALRTTWGYRWLGLRLGSAAIVALAAVWLTERAFDLRLVRF